MPLWVRQVQATDVQLTNVERKRDSSYAKVTLYRGTALVKKHNQLSYEEPAYPERRCLY